VNMVISGLRTSALPHTDGGDVGGGAGLVGNAGQAVIVISSSFRSPIRVPRHRTLPSFSSAGRLFARDFVIQVDFY
jgi:hypothetical protein